MKGKWKAILWGAQRAMMSYKIIANPVAGKGRAIALIDQVRSILKERKAEFDFELTKSPGHAADIARSAAERGWEAIVSLGGDGTTSEVISGLVGTGSVLGIISCGKGNDIARSLGVPADIEQAVNTLLTGEKRKIDVGLERDQVFAHIAGVGFSAEVTSQANNMRKLKGSLAFLAATYRTLSHLKARQVRIELDNEVIETKVVSVTVSNMKYAGGGMVFAPDAVVDDGLFDVCIVSEIGKVSLALTFPQMYKDAGPKHPALSRYRSSIVRIFSESPMEKMLDGNINGKTPLEAEILAKAVQVLVPFATRDDHDVF
jgi:diacylglycerol kinase (ATP)